MNQRVPCIWGFVLGSAVHVEVEDLQEDIVGERTDSHPSVCLFCTDAGEENGVAEEKSCCQWEGRRVRTGPNSVIIQDQQADYHSH